MNAVSPVETLITDHLDQWTTALKRKSTAGRGSSSKVELYGIKKLRELILELAVRGLLVPQEPNDEPASELLKKIATEKAKLVKEGRIKKEKSIEKMPPEKALYALPTGWAFEQLGKLSIQITDGTHYTPTYVASGVPFISVKDIDGQTVSFDDCKYISQEEHVAINERCNPEEGDLLICRIGTLGRATIVDTPKPFSLFVSVGLLKFVQHLYTPRFTHIVLKSPLLVRQYEEIKAGGSHTNKLNLSDLPKLILPVAPLREQHRIVAKVDELMTLCDQLEQQTDASLGAHQTLVETLLSALTTAADHAQFASAWLRIAGHFDTLFTTEESIAQLKQTILQLAVMGKLVQQDPNDEPATELLKKIAAEKAKLVKEGKIKKEKPLSPIEESDQPFKLPRGWQWARIEKATLFSEYGISAKTYESEDGIPVLKMGDIQDGKVLLGGQKKADRDFEGINELMLEDGDLLYNRTNSAELVGKTGIFRGPGNLYSFASYLIRIRCFDSAVQPAFLNANMNSMLFRKTQIEPHLKQQCGQANVNGTIMKNMIIPVAPIEEQTRIIAKLDELMALCDQLKSRLSDAQITQLHLADALVERAIG
jgi:type I restriction enzyme, S subunit